MHAANRPLRPGVGRAPAWLQQLRECTRAKSCSRIGRKRVLCSYARAACVRARRCPASGIAEAARRSRGAIVWHMPGPTLGDRELQPIDHSWRILNKRQMFKRLKCARPPDLLAERQSHVCRQWRARARYTYAHHIPASTQPRTSAATIRVQLRRLRSQVVARPTSIWVRTVYVTPCMHKVDVQAGTVIRWMHVHTRADQNNLQTRFEHVVNVRGAS